jgi:S-formylglutathione hydrolase
MQRIEHHACCGGRQEVWQHTSATLGCPMRLGVYLPPQALRGEPCPVLYWLSGLTCTSRTSSPRPARSARGAARLIVVAPDTSPARRTRCGRRPSLRPGPGRGLLPQRHAGALGRALPHGKTTWSRSCRRWSKRTSRPPQPGARDQRPFDGRPRRADAGAAPTRALRQRLGLLAHRRAQPGALGAESLCRLPGGATAAPGRTMPRGPDRRARRNACRCWSTRARPTNFPGHPAAPRAAAGRLQRRRPPADAAPAAPGYDHSYYFIASFIGEHSNGPPRHTARKP